MMASIEIPEHIIVKGDYSLKLEVVSSINSFKRGWGFEGIGVMPKPEYVHEM